MASFKGVLTVGTFSTPINFFHLNIFQSVDSLGRPASQTRGGTMTIEFNSTADRVVAQWMIDPAMRFAGSVVFMQIDMPVKLREILFENAYCIDLHERSDGTGAGGQMVTTIVISPEIINAGNIKLDKKWPATE